MAHEMLHTVRTLLCELILALSQYTFVWTHFSLVTVHFCVLIGSILSILMYKGQL